MKILVTGINGQLGHEVVKILNTTANTVLGVDVDQMNLQIPTEIEKVLTGFLPDCVIHCGAYTAVDRAESHLQLCKAINADATSQIAKICASINSKLIYVSTDYVFDGTGENLWQTDSPCNPQNVYGNSKYLGEQAIKDALERYFIVRTSWVFGKNGNNFIKTMLNNAHRECLKVVNDQIGSPTYAVDLALLLVKMSATDSFGTYHATNENFCSWYELAQATFALSNLNPNLQPIPTDQYPTPAKRPLNSRLSKSSLSANNFDLLPTWQNALERYLTLSE